MSKNKNIVFNPIGTIYSPFENISDMPIQPAAAEGIAGKVEINKDLTEGLKDL